MHGVVAAACPTCLCCRLQQASQEEGSELAVPPPVSRRTLELLVYLARHQPRLAREIIFQLVPSPAAPAPAVEVVTLNSIIPFTCAPLETSFETFGDFVTACP